jgi:hypothetical protein
MHAHSYLRSEECQNPKLAGRHDMRFAKAEEFETDFWFRHTSTRMSGAYSFKRHFCFQCLIRRIASTTEAYTSISPYTQGRSPNFGTIRSSTRGGGFHVT